MKFGYVRVSSKDQNPARQREALQREGVEEFYIDYASGKDTERPKLKELLQCAHKQDTIIVASMDRLARSLSDLLRLVDELSSKNVTLIFLKEKITFGPKEDPSPFNRFALQITGAFAELERSLIRERQKEGIAIAKREGKYKGRPRSISDETVGKIKELLETGVPKATIAKKVGVSRTSLYRYVEKFK